MRYRHRLKRVLHYLGLALAILLLPSGVGLARAVVECRMWETPAANDLGSPPTDAKTQHVTKNISNYVRAEDATYLTLPEWYVVYSTDEYATFIAKNPPSQFPYFQAAGQFWESWYDVCKVTRGRYPLNGGYQFALVVIGINFTTENVIRGAYELTAGRFTEWISTSELTEEDAYARQVAKEYGDFIHMIPWYDFPFSDRLRTLWTGTSLWGRNPIRKWERKLSLSTDYGMKAFYGWVIAKGATVVYGGPDDLKIYAVVEGVNDGMLAREPEIKVVQKINEQQSLVALTRFEVFTQIVPGLTQNGLRFIEIAGNDEILVTVFAPKNQNHIFEHAEYLFDLPVLTQPELTRVALKVKVRDLHLLLQELKDKNSRLEHIYDY